MRDQAQSERPSDSEMPSQLLVALLLGFVALLNFPNLNFDLDELFWIDGWGPDPSMFVALHMAVRDGMQFGRDVIFTYGPLGYLTFPVYIDDGLWIDSVIYQLAAHALLFISLFGLLRKTAAPWWKILGVGVVTGVFLQAIGGWLIDLKLQVALLVLAYLRITGDRRGAWRDAALAALAAFPLYIKFSGGVTAFLILAVFVLLLLGRRQLLRAARVVAAYCAAALGLGLHLIGSLEGIGLFLRQSFEIAASYVDAVAVEGPAWQVGLAVLAGIAYVALLGHDLLRRERRGGSFLLLASGLCLAGFKHGFVRHDAHVAGFFAIWMMVATLYLVAAAPDLRAAFGKTAGAFAAGLTALASAMVFLNSGDFFFHRIFTSMPVDIRNLPRFVSFVNEERPAFLVASTAERRRLMERALAKVPDSNLAPTTVARIAGGSVDIFPWDVAIAERFGLRWNPRPMFQSYSAFSARLDAGNAAHFVGANAPDHVLYGHRSVDGRCPTFDEPETFRSLLTRYRALARDEAFVLLERAEVAAPDTETTIASLESSLGTAVEVPRSTSGYVFARVHLDYSWLGRVARLVYKPPPVYIRLLSRGMALKYRLVPSTARNGLFVSRYILGPRDLLDVWNGRDGQEIDAIAITTDDPAYFAPELRIEFFQIPHARSARRRWKVACGKDDRVLVDAKWAIDVVQGEHLASLKQPIEIDRSEPLVVSGWAVDEVAGDLAGDVFVEIDGVLAAPTDYERSRRDVAEFLGSDAYAYSGFSANLDLESVAAGRHVVGVRIVSKDGKRCYEPAGGIRIRLRE